MSKEKTPVASSIKNYILNGVILLLIFLVIYLSYSMLSPVMSAKQNTKKDSLATNITNQPNLTIQIEVRNATGENKIAQLFADFLRTKGFDVVEMGNFQTSDEPRSLIIDRRGNKDASKKIAKTLGLSERNVIEQQNKELYIDATVVIGKDYKELKPYLEKNVK